MPRFRNWARTASCRIERFVQPASEEELVALVKQTAASGGRLKVVGAGHSWSEAACTDGTLVNLDRLDRVLEVDRERGLVTVEAGIRLGALNDALAAHGLAMPVLGSVCVQSLAGAISTGTHGSAPRKGSLASAVVGLRLVDGTGRVHDATKASDPDLLDAARVGLGALGVVTRVTLQVEPAFRLEETVEPLPFDEAVARIPQLWASEEFVKLWWVPHTTHALIFRYRRTQAPSTWSRLAMWMDVLTNRVAFAFLLFLSRLSSAFVPLVNTVVQASYFRPRKRIDRSDRCLSLTMPPRHDEMEYALPLERAADAFRFARDAIEKEGLRVNFIVELRFTAADEPWMSPAYGRDTCWLGAYIAPSASLERYFEVVEAQMLAWGGRPHWGKRFAVPADTLRRHTPRYDDFAALRDRLDPQRVFANAFLDRVLPQQACAKRNASAG